MTKRILDMKVLPGQPTDGSGRICIHLFVPDERGPFIEPQVSQIVQPSKDVPQEMIGRHTVGPKRGRLACSATRTVRPVTKGGVTSVTMRTNDPRAATCPTCLASPQYAALMSVLNSLNT